MPVFAITIFLSAFLLFLVQPMMAKLILPWFGGSAAVWITCLVFYQLALLAGYLYAHRLARLAAQRQALAHAGLLAVSFALLPVTPAAAWKPVNGSEPILGILILLLVTIGLPFILLSATSPLLQACYTRVAVEAKPYRFFAVSNAGSLLGLLCYPLLVEPWLPTRWQAVAWSGAYAITGALIGLVMLRHRGASAPVAEDAHAPLPDRSAQMLWIALPACGATLLYATTSHLTQNLAAIPFLWVLPLSLYLLSFVLTFGPRPLYRRGLFLKLLAVAQGAMAYSLDPDFANAGLELLLPLYLTGLFLCCMVCHGELAHLKPAPKHLTRFYLHVSIGGALGGLYAGVFAPLAYSGYYEFQVALGSCAVLALFAMYCDPESNFYRARWQPAWIALLALTAVLIGCLYWTVRATTSTARLTARNFYGSLRVTDYDNVKVTWFKEGREQLLLDPRAQRKLTHGTIDHGVQFLSPERQREPAGYYAQETGVGRALDAAIAAAAGPIRVGVVGLGTGTLATYGRVGDVYRFYEINPLVERIARTEFTYLKDTPATVEVVAGDARLAMEREAEQSYDVLAVDAFSSDAIPVHLLTLEAFRLYFRHIKPGGVLVLHLSNRYVELQPVVAAAAAALGKQAMVYKTASDTAGKYATTWAVVGDAASLTRPQLASGGKPPAALPGFRPWTDDFSNLLRLLR